MQGAVAPKGAHRHCIFTLVFLTFVTYAALRVSAFVLLVARKCDSNFCKIIGIIIICTVTYIYLRFTMKYVTTNFVLFLDCMYGS